MTLLAFSRCSVLLLGMALGCLCACRSNPAPVAAAPVDPAAVLAADRELGEALLEDFRLNRAGAFLAKLPPEVRREFGEAQFQTARAAVTESRGELVNADYLTTLEMPMLRPRLWKVRFHRRTPKGEDVYQEMLFRVVLGTLDGKPYIMTFGFL